MNGKRMNGKRMNGKRIVKIDDIYNDLKNLVEKTHTAIVLENNKSLQEDNPQENNKSLQEDNPQENKSEVNQEIQNIKIKYIEKKTISCQTSTTKTTSPETYRYVTLPAAGRRGTRTNTSILNWSRSLRFPYY
jgi:hypothetical protein